jgi:hypothetical protein
MLVHQGRVHLRICRRCRFESVVYQADAGVCGGGHQAFLLYDAAEGRGAWRGRPLISPPDLARSRFRGVLVHRRDETRWHRPVREPFMQSELLRRKVDHRTTRPNGHICEPRDQEGRGAHV